MSLLDRVKESAGTTVTILGFIGVIGSVTAYGTNLKNQFDASQTKIVQLETEVATLRNQLDKSYNAGTQALRGAKGDKGDPGDRGEQGPRGERGPAGDSVDMSTLTTMIREAVSKQISSINLTSNPVGTTAFLDTSGGFDFSKCIPAADVRKSPSLQVKKGLEVCDADGSLLVRVDAVLPDDGSVQFFTPGDGKWYGYATSTKSFNWDRARAFTVERFGNEQGKNATALLRFVSQ